MTRRGLSAGRGENDGKQDQGNTAEGRETGPETPDAPLPLLDLSGAAVKKMIKQAKKRGYVPYEQL
jgi:RNA polymerase primary sigma factor